MTGHRRRRFALLIDSLGAEYEVQMRAAVEGAAARHDIEVLITMGQRLGGSDPTECAQNSIYTLLSPQTVDGVIVVSSTIGHYYSTGELARFCRGFAPLPVCSVGVALDGIPSIVIDNAGGMERAVTHLIETHGCQRIAFIAGPKNSTESEERLVGYRQALVQHNLVPDERLVVYGEFSVASGGTALTELIERGVVFDALVCANDYMALGAMDVLKAQGMAVPRDLLLCGFDDIAAAQFANPSLTSLRQPIRWLGKQAVELLVQSLGGESPALYSSAPTELVRRESCGCGYQQTLTARPQSEGQTIEEVLATRRKALEEMLVEAVAVTPEALGNWPGRLLDALEEELMGTEGRFIRALDYVLNKAQTEGASLDEFQRVVSLLRSEMRGAQTSDGMLQRQMERLWHTARVVIGAASIRVQGRMRMDGELASFLLGRSSHRLGTALSLPLMRQALADELPGMGITRASVSLYTDVSAQTLKPFFMMLDGREVETQLTAFPANQLGPSGVLDPARCESSIAIPLTFEATQLGVAVLAGTANSVIYEGLRQQVSSAIKGASLHREVVQQVAIRERLEQERLREESRVAAHIQTAMSPTSPEVPGLEVAAVMLPAAEAGGDYYDVLPTPDGAWLGIGDVAGHGLGAGMIMLMVQSMVASLARVVPELKPSAMVTILNEALFDNVHHRLGRTEYVTLTVLRYLRDGNVEFCGAHEDIILWRASTGRCETISPPGLWVGAIPSIREISKDAALKLEDGDLLVLYSDGLTEARNAHHEQFSLERLVAAVEQLGSQPVRSIRDRLLELVENWCTAFDDDRTLLVARYRAK